MWDRNSDRPDLLSNHGTYINNTTFIDISPIFCGRNLGCGATANVISNLSKWEAFKIIQGLFAKKKKKTSTIKETLATSYKHDHLRKKQAEHQRPVLLPNISAYHVKGETRRRAYILVSMRQKNEYYSRNRFARGGRDAKNRRSHLHENDALPAPQGGSQILVH